MSAFLALLSISLSAVSSAVLRESYDALYSSQEEEDDDNVDDDGVGDWYVYESGEELDDPDLVEEQSDDDLKAKNANLP